MKKLATTLLLAFAWLVTWAQQPDLGLIPTPRQVETSAGGRTCTLAKAKVVERRVSWDKAAPGQDFDGNAAQAYRLTVEPSRITIEYQADEGLQYARLTLDQLRQLHTTLPCLTLTDWPAYALRGWMDDISRGPVTHAAYRQHQWAELHALKYNFCNYYTEHTLYQAEFPDLAPAEADAPRHPDEVINLQLFAHAEKTLRIPFYQSMMDSRANFNPDAEETYAFLRKRIAEAMRQLPDAQYFIIDCDETEQLGTGRARALVDSLGADDVYVRHINRCYGIIRELNKDIRVVMWGDIVAKNPQMMRQLPADMVYIMWAYEPLDSYAHLIRPFAQQGNPFWVAPSLSHSSVMLPAPQRYMKNIANLARDGHRAGAQGLMNTCWDDNGEALFDNCWHGLYWSAEMAWNPIRTDDPLELRQREEQFNRNFERLFYKAPADTAAPRVADLYAVGALEGNADVAEWYTSAGLMEPLLAFNPANTNPFLEPSIDQRVHNVGELWMATVVDSAANPHAHYAMERIRLAAFKAMLRRQIFFMLTHDSATLAHEPNVRSMDEYLQSYLEGLHNLKREYLRLWDQENGTYERHLVADRYDALAREVLELDRHVFIDVNNSLHYYKPEPVKQHGAEQVKLPSGKVYGFESVPMPSTLGEPVMVSLRTLWNDRPIFYTLDGSVPDSSSTRYTGPFPLAQSATIRAIAYNQHGEGVITEQYTLAHKAMGKSITLRTPYSTYKAAYSGGSAEALVDGQLGSDLTYADGHWQGYWGDSIDAVIDLGTPTNISSVEMRFMQNTFDWVLAPTAIRLYGSADGRTWQPLADERYAMDPRDTGMRLRRYRIGCSTRVRFLRVVVPNPGPLPQWHPAPGQPSYLFADEIVVQ